MLTLVAAAILSFMIFFPLVVATSVFKVLDEKQSSKFLRIFFPKYYLYGFVLSVIGLTLSAYYQIKLSMLISGKKVLPFLFQEKCNTENLFKLFCEFFDNYKFHKDKFVKLSKDLENEIKFNKLHKFSVFINFLQIIGCIFLLVTYLK